MTSVSSGTVDAQKGPNCIEVIAESLDGTRREELVPLSFRYPDGYLDRIREGLVTQMEHERRRAALRRELVLEVEGISPLLLIEDSPDQSR